MGRKETRDQRASVWDRASKKTLVQPFLWFFLFVPNADHQEGLLRGSHFWLPRKFSQSQRIPLSAGTAAPEVEAIKTIQVAEPTNTALFTSLPQNTGGSASSEIQLDQENKPSFSLDILSFWKKKKKSPKVSWEADASDWDSFHFNWVAKLSVEWIIKEELKSDGQTVSEHWRRIY